MFDEKNERPCLSYIVFSKSIIKCLPNKTTFPESRSVLWQVLSYWMQASKEQLKAKMTWLDVYILRSARFDVLFLKGVFTPSLVQPKKKIIGREGN